MIFPALINLISCDVDTVPLKTVNRQCSSGLQAVADVASAIKAGMYNIGMFYRRLILIILFWLHY
jgi:acetyl-CoA acetyltransferase